MKEVKVFKPMPPLLMVEYCPKDQKLFLDTLPWWTSRAHDYILLVPTPLWTGNCCAEEELERVFSSAGFIVTKKCNFPSVDNAQLVVFLRNSRAIVDFIKKSRGQSSHPL